MKHSLRRRLLVSLGLVLVPLVASAQWWKVTRPEDVWLFQVGMSADLNMVMHNGDFVLPQAPTCCVGYTSAQSFGPAISAFLRQEVTKTFRLTLRGTFAPYSGTFETDENIFVSGATEGVTRHTLDARMSWLGGEFLFDVRVFNPMRLMLGFSAGVMTQPTFTQEETLIVPGTGTFENGRRVRNETVNAEMTGLTSPQLGAVIGLGYDIPLTENHSVMLTPEVLYTIGLSDVVEGQDWKANMLRIGASVALSLNAPEPPTPVERRREEFVDSVIVDVAPDAERRRVVGSERIVTDTIVTTDLVTITDRAYRTDTVFSPPPPVVTAKIAARAVEASGVLKDVFTINVSTQFITEALPILPVVFFEAQSISLSFRYHQVADSKEYNAASIAPRTTAVHREILNIVGDRMRDMPNTSIRLRGTSDPTTEGADCDLARKRASAVKDYLVRVWGVSADRIAVESGGSSCAPERATRQQSEEGYSENRRVEILTNDLVLLASVAKRRFNEAQTVDPPKILFDPYGTSQQYLTDWSLEATSGSTVVFSQSGKGVPGQITQVLTPATADLMQDGKPVEVKLKVNAIRGVSASATTQLAVKKDTTKIELERLTLTLFDVASDEITPIAEEQIKTFIENVPAGSTVVVRGYADMLGNAEFNKKLSQKRADAVCSTIKKHLKKRVDLACNEIRTDRFPPGIESYATPEERFLSRTVQIEVKRGR
ncbi:MAG TPA: OmpA family protein [Candidatus Didemnitutus sp.]|nr:OmpA family protein [Candidatus Didemnitutus sp.]